MTLIAKGAAPDLGASGATVTEWTNWPRSAIGGGAKRVFDVVVACIAMVFIAPILLGLMIAVHLQDGGPSLYGHSRIGLGGRRFKCLKIRSMVQNSQEVLERHLAENPEAAREWAATQKLRNDPRVTPLGSFLRKSSLDELPQLINVIRGEMSLVGPRPIVTDELSRYGLAKVHYLKARPGITGLWQISGRSDTTYEERVHLDKTYALRWSFATDVAIIMKTIPALISRKGAV